ncbi:MAG: hypothetical protein Q4C03_07350, partial [bacterium]|nr:hypothetical protein [bacterium]
VGEPIVKQYTLPAPKDYAIATTQIDCPALEHGTYTVTLTTDKHTFQELKQTPAKAQLVISDFTLACVARNPVTYFVADIQTGEPCVGAELVCNGQKATTNNLGLAVLSLPKNPLNSVFQVTYKGKTLVQENTFLQEPRYNSTGRTFLLYPNCGIYRPGDKVQVQILALEDDATRRRKQALKNFSMPLKVVGRTAKGDSVTLFEEQIVTFSERGVVDIAFTLPEDFVGSMTLELPKENRRTFGLPQVLEFKPPAMSVSVEEMKKDTCFGESVPVKIKAVDASNVPLEGAKATCKIALNEKTREEIVTLDAKGEAMLSILPEADRTEAKEGAYTWRNVQLDIQVVAANGERSDAGLLVSQCRYGYTLKMKLPDWKLANEAFTMRVTSDERASVEGTLAIYTYVKEKDAKADAYQRGEKVYEVPLNDTLNYPITLPAGNYLAVATSGKVERSESFIVLPQDGDLNKVDIGLQQRYYWDPQELFFIIHDTDPATGQPKTFTVGTAVECYIAAKTPMPFFYAISTLDGTKTIRKCEGNRFFVSVTPDMIGNASLMLFGLSDGRFYSSSEEVTITPPPELTVTATRVPEEVLPGSEQTWELTVDDPTAEMVITCYDAMIDRISPLRWSLINSTFPTLGWSHRARLRPYYS